MMPQEQERVLFADDSVYISDTRLALPNGESYFIANLSRVSCRRVAASRSWISLLIFGIFFLALGPLINWAWAVVGHSMPNPIVGHSVSNPMVGHTVPNGEPYLAIIGVLLLLISFVSVLFQIMYPLYVVVLNGTARPISSRNKSYILKLVEILNEAISKRSLTHPPQVSQIFQDFSSHSRDIIIHQDQGAQAHINTSDNISNVKQVFAAKSPIFNPDTSDNSSLKILNNARQASPYTDAADDSRVSGWADRPTGRGTDARKIIISYSHEDRQWRDRLRTHLAPLEQQQIVELWDDTQIRAGTHTQQAMSDALKAADFALLLVSAKFLESDAIIHQILQRLSLGQFTIMPLILSPCLYDRSPLGKYQPFNPSNPLSMLSYPEQDEVLVRVAEEVQKVVR